MVWLGMLCVRVCVCDGMVGHVVCVCVCVCMCGNVSNPVLLSGQL